MAFKKTVSVEVEYKPSLEDIPSMLIEIAEVLKKYSPHEMVNAAVSNLRESTDTALIATLENKAQEYLKQCTDWEAYATSLETKVKELDLTSSNTAKIPTNLISK